jgi:purine nucleosidase
MTTKILLDTDIGSDIDDAVALAYLLAQPKCELLGITTVTGEAEKRAMLASALCQYAGKETPIYPGAESPLLIPQAQPRAPQAAVLARWSHASQFPRGEAVEFLRRTIHAHPGQVTLLTIAPLTNIALLFCVDPEIPRLLKGLVMMCGVFSTNGISEWNARLDPHATEIVYRAPVAIHRSIGLDVTLKVSMPIAEVRARFDTPRLHPVRDFAEIWFEQNDRLTFHDPLAAATIFDPQICSFERGKVEINLTDVPGQTGWTPAGEDMPHEIAQSVDPQRFFEHYFGTIRRS